jgi:4-hydroxybenzoate polyprenyltransferase
VRSSPYLNIISGAPDTAAGRSGERTRGTTFDVTPAETTAAAPAARRAARPALVRLLRPHQWSKNLLLFVPLAAAHRLQEPALAARATIAFVAFSLCASAAYVVNDLVDRERDRAHPTKRLRPIAAGEIGAGAAAAIAAALLAAGVAVAAFVGLPFLALAAAYLAATTLYSLRLKTVPMLDVMILAGLYTVRLFSGAIAIGVPLSEWLLTFSMFLFLSLALVKRTSELRRHGARTAGGRGYVAEDERQLASLGAAAGYVAVLVLALYVSGDHVRTLYAHPGGLWLLCPILLYWVGRIWMLANRGLVHDDPVLFALRDRVSWLLGAAAAIVLVLSS